MSEKTTEYYIIITDPSRWGLKYSEKRKWNYQLRTDFFSDLIIIGLKNETKLLFLELILQSLRVNKHELNISLTNACRLLNISLNAAKGFLNELEVNDIIHLQRRPRCSYKIEKNKKEKNKIAVKKTANDFSAFDFDLIYSKYPRKVGKKAGLSRFKSEITTPEKYAQLTQAVNNYARQCAQDGTEKKYIKQFSTFMNCWEDYVDLVTDQDELDIVEKEFIARMKEYEKKVEGVNYFAGLIDDV